MQIYVQILRFCAVNVSLFIVFIFHASSMKTTSLSVLSYLLHVEFSFVARVSSIRHGYLFKSRFIYSHHSDYKWRSQIRETVAWFRGNFGTIAKDLPDTNREIKKKKKKQAKNRNAFQ